MGVFVVLGDFFGWLVLGCGMFFGEFGFFGGVFQLFFPSRWIQESTHLDKSHEMLIE